MWKLVLISIILTLTLTNLISIQATPNSTNLDPDRDRDPTLTLNSTNSSSASDSATRDKRGYAGTEKYGQQAGLDAVEEIDNNKRIALWSAQSAVAAAVARNYLDELDTTAQFSAAYTFPVTKEQTEEAFKAVRQQQHGAKISAAVAAAAHLVREGQGRGQGQGSKYGYGYGHEHGLSPSYSPSPTHVLPQPQPLPHRASNSHPLGVSRFRHGNFQHGSGSNNKKPNFQNSGHGHKAAQNHFRIGQHGERPISSPNHAHAAAPQQEYEHDTGEPEPDFVLPDFAAIQEFQKEVAKYEQRDAELELQEERRNQAHAPRQRQPQRRPGHGTGQGYGYGHGHGGHNFRASPNDYVRNNDYEAEPESDPGQGHEEPEPDYNAGLGQGQNYNQNSQSDYEEGGHGQNEPERPEVHGGNYNNEFEPPSRNTFNNNNLGRFREQGHGHRQDLQNTRVNNYHDGPHQHPQFPRLPQPHEIPIPRRFQALHNQRSGGNFH